MLIVGDDQVQVVSVPPSKARLVRWLMLFIVCGLALLVGAVVVLNGHGAVFSRGGAPAGSFSRSVLAVFLAVLGLAFLAGAVLGVRRVRVGTAPERFALDATGIRIPPRRIPLAEVDSIAIAVNRPNPVTTSLRGTIMIRTPRHSAQAVLTAHDVSVEEFERLGGLLRETGERHGFPVLDDQGYRGRDLR